MRRDETERDECARKKGEVSRENPPDYGYW